MHVYGDEIPDSACSKMRYLHTVHNAARFHLFHYGIDENVCQDAIRDVTWQYLCVAPGGSGIDCAADELRRVNQERHGE